VNRNRQLLASLAVAGAAIAGVFALGHTLALGQQARSAQDRQIARRSAQLDRYEASLRKALRQKPPALPPLPSDSPPRAGAHVHVVYHRPPAIVVTTHRQDGEHENGVEGADADD